MILRDKKGNPCRIYRGGSLKNLEAGHFFCNDIKVARAMSSCGTLSEVTIRTENPLIIDAQGRHWGYLKMEEKNIYPTDVEHRIPFMEKIDKSTNGFFSAESFVKYAKESGYDCAIIINTIEGSYADWKEKYYITDINIWDEKNIASFSDISNEEDYNPEMQEIDFTKYEDGYFVIKNIE